MKSNALKTTKPSQKAATKKTPAPIKKGDRTRKRIVALSAPVFNQKGFAATALSDLMQATGLEKGGIYRHFDSKQALAEEAFDHAWQIAMAVRFEGTAQIANSVDRLQHLLKNFRQRRKELVPGGCPLLNTAVESENSNPRLHDKARGALHFWLDRLRPLIEEGKRRGEIRSTIDSRNLATLLVSTLEGALMVTRLEGKSTALELACDHLEHYLETSVRAPSKKS